MYKDYPYNAGDGREDVNAEGGRLLRGGSWGYLLHSLHGAFRDGFDPNFLNVNLGFRLLFSVLPGS